MTTEIMMDDPDAMDRTEAWGWVIPDGPRDYAATPHAGRGRRGGAVLSAEGAEVQFVDVGVPWEPRDTE